MCRFSARSGAVRSLSRGPKNRGSLEDDKADSFNLWPIVQCLRDPQCIACFPVKGWAPTDVGLSTAALAAMLTHQSKGTWYVTSNKRTWAVALRPQWIKLV